LPWPAQSWSAEQEGEYDPNGTHWRLGIGGGLLQKAYAGVDGEGIPLPLLIFENRWISLPGPGIDFKLPLDERWLQSLRLVGSCRHDKTQRQFLVWHHQRVA
jgi:hypothetical protein